MQMGRTLDEVINQLPPDRQARIASLAEKKMDEMIAHATTLTDFRKAVGKTQVEMAKELGIKQNAVSQLEQRSDTYVSTLRRFLQSLGLTLELSVVSKNGTRINLPNFHPWEEADPDVPTARPDNVAMASPMVSGDSAIKQPRETFTKKQTRSLSKPPSSDQKAPTLKKQRTRI
jgi:transcriptional regulator with XRE-family HTH domain